MAQELGRRQSSARGLIRHDLPRRSMLLERLGPSLASLGWPRVGRLTTAASALARGWRPAPGAAADGRGEG